MDKVRVYRQGSQVEIDPTSLPAAESNAKGAVKQGYGIAKDPDPRDSADKKINGLIDSLRDSGVIVNDKFVLIYDRNFPQGVDEGGNFPIDNNVYTAGQTASVSFGDDGTPYCSGHRFKGWATSASASTPTYPYNESDPQSYSVTFVDNDITLYAVWEAVTVTITYSLGEYGQGGVPAQQTVAEGEEAQISFSPAPTVNDGSGRVFAGWATTDGGNTISDATYTSDGTNYIYLYNDVTLYPVFVAQYTLTYALGNDATGTVPSAGTYWDGETADLNFNPSVTCVSDNTKVFAGWSMTDEDSSATYTALGTSSIYMNSNVTLYPVFVAQGGGGGVSDAISVVNSTSDKTITITHQGGKDPVVDLEISAGSTETFSFTDQVEYTFNLPGKSFDGTAIFTGTYGGTGFTNEILTVSGEVIYSPTGSSTWYFSSGDSGTITVSDSIGS